MVKKELIEDILYKLGLDDFDFELERNDQGGDFLEVLCLGLGFGMLKSRVLETKPFKEHIVDVGPDAIVLVYKDTFDGFGVEYNVKFVQTDLGVRILVGTKRIDYFNFDGEHKVFVTFEMMREYIESFDREE
jgi:hypothetical protein